LNKDYTQLRNKTTQNEPWMRKHTAEGVIDFEQAKNTQSQREFAKQSGIPQSTLQHWINRKHALDGSQTVIDFFESPDGLAFLHRLITAAHFIFTKDGVASIHNVSQFLKLNGLSTFVASSYSTQRLLSNVMNDRLIEFGETEEERLSKAMRKKKLHWLRMKPFTLKHAWSQLSQYLALLLPRNIQKIVKVKHGQSSLRIQLKNCRLKSYR
jgi:hypothetical protein